MGKVEFVGGSGGLGREGCSIDVILDENASGSCGGPSRVFERMIGVRVSVEGCRRRGLGVGMRVAPLDGRTGFVDRRSR